MKMYTHHKHAQICCAPEPGYVAVCPRCMKVHVTPEKAHQCCIAPPITPTIEVGEVKVAHKRKAPVRLRSVLATMEDL